ncbi:MAG: hypothetical protein CBD59_00870 [Alphaproteobacteria bacterium TMED199]|nr:MAG: hypothetical protein CBD59_00870 [Alphaproteobacteria bacterium TMED199]
MDKEFFKINHKINLLDILHILDISKDEIVFKKENLDVHPEKINIEDFVSFENLKKNKLSFFTNVKSNFKNVSSGICIAEKENFKYLNKDIIKIPYSNPKKGFSKILKKYVTENQQYKKENKIHPSAIVHKTAKIGKNVFIGAYSIIGEDVIIEDNTYISERVTISSNCKVGKECFIGAGVFIECTVLNKKVNVAHNTVLGKIGFGFIPENTNTILTPHVGSLIIGKGTNIGSGCTIDRGLIDKTQIGKYVMIDNQVHIGHNCVIDDFCILAGQVGLSGSVVLEKNVILGGDVSVKNNIKIGEGSIVAGASKVFNSFPKASKIGGSPAQDINSWKRLVASQRLSYKKRKKN